MADISGFTAMSERLATAGKEGAEWLTAIINSYFGSMLDFAWDLGGTALTFGGDAMLLLFYGPDHAACAVLASMRMLEATTKLTSYRVGSHRIKLGMSMGAHSGQFLMASVGTTDRLQYLVLGPETVRTAGAESLAERGELAVTAETLEQLCGVETDERDGLYVVKSTGHVPDYRLDDQSSEFGSANPAALAPYLPPFVSTTLLEGKEITPPEQEHRKVTIVFVNVMGIDDLIGRAGPSCLVDEMQQYAECLTRLTHKNNGYLVSSDIYTDGCKFILAFGAPIAHEHDTVNAMRCITALRDEVQRMDLHLTHRIGINAGFVFAGDVGPSYRRQYTVMGDAVNLAARLMSAAVPGQIMASRSVVDEAESRFVVTDLAPIRVKGKEAPIPVCTVEAECERGQQPAELAHDLFGRDAEMALLDRAARDAEGARGCLAIVEGEPGIGKSRLTLELQNRLAHDGWTVMKSGCLEHTRHKPFGAWLRIVEGALSIARVESGVRTSTALDALQRLVPDMAAFGALLNPLLELSIPASEAVDALDDSTRRDRLIELIASVVLARAVSRPLLLQIEDVHWSDDSSLALIHEIACRLGSARMLLLLTSRGAVDELEDVASLTVIHLVELSQDASLELVRTVLGVDYLPDTVVAALLLKSKGNPLFLEEVAQALSAGAVLEVATDRSGIAVADKLDALEIPDRVQGLLMARIDALEPIDREVLRQAAVVGPGFTESELVFLAKDPSQGALVPECLNRLKGLGLVEPLGDESTAEFRFRHALIQDVAYDTIRFARRRELHRLVGLYVEEQFPDALAQHYEALVHHAVRARDDARTRVYAVKAAEKASGVFAHREAIDYYEMAVAATRARTSSAALERSGLVERVGDSYELAGEHNRAIEAFKSALGRLTHAHSTADGAQRGPGTEEELRASLLCHKIAMAYERGQERFDRASAWVDRALRELPSEDPGHHAAICVTKGFVLMRQGRYEEMVQWGERAVALAREAQDLATAAWATNMLSMHAWITGEMHQAVAYQEASVKLLTEIGDLRRLAAAEGNLAVFYECVGRLSDSAEHNRACIELYERIKYETGIMIAKNNLGEVLVKEGKLAGAERHFEEAVEGCGGAGWVAGLALVNLSRVNRIQGHLDEAAAFVERAVTLLAHTDRGHLEEALVESEWLRLEQGDVRGARDGCLRLLAEVRALGMKPLEARLHYIVGMADRREGNYDQAEESLLRSVEVADAAGMCYERALALVEYGRALGEAGQPRWKAPVDEAVEVFRSMGAERDLAMACCLRDAAT